jgi:hypothetical protein
MVEFGVGVIDRDLPFERFADLNFGAGETEAFGLGRDLETVTVPLYDVVVADAAFVQEAADAIEVFRSQAPSLFGVPRSATEAAIIIGENGAGLGWRLSDRQRQPDGVRW